MTDVFLSYRRETGSEFCSFLREILLQEGYSVFFDCHSLRQGAFDEQIDRAITECTYLLLILAPHDLDRCLQEPDDDWILHEVGLAKELGKIVIPVSIKKGFIFPKSTDNATLEYLSRQEICDVSGPDAAELVRTRLFQFMQESPATKLKEEYIQGLKKSEYQEWEASTLRSIYHDCKLVHLLGRTYPVVVYQGSEEVIFPFDALNKQENLLGRTAPLDYTDYPLYDDFKKIIGPTVHFPNLYGFTNAGILLDSSGKVEGFKAIPRTYKETVFSGHIMHYELWRAFQRFGKQRPATLTDLPIRKMIHTGQKSNQDVLLSGCNRSSLCDVCIAVLAYDELENDFDIAIATRSTSVACYPGYLSIIPSGGFELYELETKQDDINIQRNFKIIAALYREYIEELFGDEEFEQPNGDDDVRRLYRNEHIKALRGQIGKTYAFEFLGIIIDLISLRPTFAFVLKIDDPGFLYENQIRKNQENTDLRFLSLSELEKTIQAGEELSPLMPESAGVYTLLKENHLYKEAISPR